MERSLAFELASFNAAALPRTHLVAVAVMSLWSIVDWLALDSHFVRFLAYRLVAIAFASALVASPLRKKGTPRQTWLLTAIWLLTWAIAVALMIPDSEGHWLLYCVGLSVVGLAAGVLPVWPVAWATGSVVSIGLVGLIGLSFRPGTTLWEFVDAGVLYASIGVGAIVAAGWKAAFAEREFHKSQALAEAAEQLAAANDELLQAQKEKTRLFHNISHELRTPLTTILAPLDDLVNGGPYRKDDIRMMRRNARRLLRLVDDILELSKLDGGGIELRVGRVNMTDLVEGVTLMLEPGAVAREIELRYHGPEEAVSAYVDAYRVETILTNLIGNAVKYTPVGGSIDVSLEAEEGRLRVAVKDTGPGVPEEMRHRIFERYVQVGEKALGGVGIGLALARELVELHKGEMSLEVPPEGGSIFSFTLPIQALSDQAGTSAPHRRPRQTTRRTEELDTGKAPVARADGTVLVVDDEPDIRSVIADTVGRQWNVVEAEDGVQALEVIRRERPDVVLADMMMPRMDGATLLREIRGDPKIAHTPVIVLTAAGGADWETAILASGADDYLSKPFSPEVLLARVRLQMRIRGLVAGLANQEKLAAIGTLTAGILHEVNNPAGCIVAMSSLIRPETAPPKLQVAHDTIRASADRIVQLTAALRSHARPDEHDIAKPFNLREGIESSMTLLAHSISGRTEVVVDCASDLEVFGPPASTNHVFLNLVENASKSGATRVELTARQVSDEEIELVVQDDGPGVPEEHKERIFNPFFTTRDVGDGTGLGLFLCRKTMLASGGSINLVRSDTGARFVLRMRRPPVKEPVTYDTRRPSSAPRPA
ncbi:MAG: ATP-binding protein [Myxococcota bacterium]